MKKALPVIDQKKCVLCGLCVEKCPRQVLLLIDQKIIFHQPEACIYCTTCEEICPQGAVSCTFQIQWA